MIFKITKAAKLLVLQSELNYLAESVDLKSEGVETDFDLLEKINVPAANTKYTNNATFTSRDGKAYVYLSYTKVRKKHIRFFEINVGDVDFTLRSQSDGVSKDYFFRMLFAAVRYLDKISETTMPKIEALEKQHQNMLFEQAKERKLMELRKSAAKSMLQDLSDKLPGEYKPKITENGNTFYFSYRVNDEEIRRHIPNKNFREVITEIEQIIDARENYWANKPSPEFSLPQS